MIKRYISASICDLALKRGKMVFLSGPRQVGKTTLSKMIRGSSAGVYGNWDDIEFRRKWTKSPRRIVADLESGSYLLLDELYKAKGWKRGLKGLYDTLDVKINIIVTGSARLGVFFKGGDSLMGRYFGFRLHPLSLSELTRRKPLSPKSALQMALKNPSHQSDHKKILNTLYQRGGFPEPYFERAEKVRNIWKASRIEKIVREDLRDLSRIPELSQVEMLISLLPEKVGSPLSLQSLKEDLEVSHDTVKRWMTYLNSLYYFFEVKPYSKNLKRSLRKEGKIYLWDWSEIE